MNAKRGVMLAALLNSLACATPKSTDLRRQLTEAVGDKRFTIGVPADMTLGPLQHVRRGAITHPDAAVLLAAVSAEQAFKNGQSAESVADFGVAALLLGDVDRAVQLLELCVATYPKRAGPLVDLSAAYLELAGRFDRPDFFPLALDAAAQALVTEPNNQSALFNRVQALAGLRYGTLAKKATADLALLNPAAAAIVVRESHDAESPESRVRDLYPLLESEISSLAQARRLGELERSRWARAGQWAEALHAFNLDQYSIDLLNLLQGTDGGGAARDLRTIEAVKASLARRDLAPALEGLAQLAASPVQPQLDLEVVYQRSVADFLVGSRIGLAKRFEEIERAARARHYLVLEIESAWMGVLAHSMARDSISETLDRLKRLETITRRGPFDLGGRIGSRISSMYRDIGAYREAWQRHAHSDPPIETLPELTALASALEREGLFFAAADFAESALKARPEAGRVARIQGDLSAMRLWRQLGQSTRSIGHLNAARMNLPGLAGDPLQSALSGEIAIARLDVDPASFSDDLFSEAESYLNRTNDRTRLPSLLLARARAHATTDPAGSTADLDRALAIVGSRPPPGRALGYDADPREAKDIVDEVLDRLVARGDIAGIIDTQAALRRSGSDPKKRGAPADTQRRVVLRYVTWKNRIALVARRGPTQRLMTLECTLEELEQLVARYHVLAESYSRGGEIDQLNQKLTDLLLSPVKDVLAGSDELLVLPDGILWNVPFPSLFDPNGHDQVGSTWALTVASSDEDAEPSGPPTPLSSILSLAYSPPGRTGISLPSAESEALAVAAIYPRGHALIGLKATRTALARGVEDGAVVHIAAHAYSSVSAPARAALYLAPETSDPDSGLIAFDDPVWESVTRARVVVLSTCMAARGRGRFAQAPPGLVSLLLAKGVRYVVASTLPIDDAAALGPMRTLHRELRQGATPAVAVLAAYRGSRGSAFAHSSGIAVYR